MNPYLAPGLKTIEDAVCDAYGISKPALKQRTRKREIITPRQISMWYRHMVLGLSQAVAAAPYGLDHATTNHACKTVRDLWQTDYNYRSTLQDIVEELHPVALLYIDDEEKLRVRTI